MSVLEDINSKLGQLAENMRTYNGNPLLKRSNVSINWTPEMVVEYEKCRHDVLYFAEHYMKIININKGLIAFEPYDYQREMLRTFEQERNTIVTTARQAGKSTTVVCFVLWYILFNPNKTVALLANKGETAREILGKVRLAYQHLPKWMQQGVVEWRKGAFSLENNSRVLAAATSSDSIRGYSINMLFIDEAAFIDDWDTFFTATYPTISSGEETKVILVSTPNGLNHFYALWENARLKRNNYKPLFVHWSAVPGRDEAWKQETLKAMNFNTEKFSQEYDAEFMGSSGTLIAGWKLRELVHQIPLHAKDGMAVYEKPTKDHVYCMVVDVSHGKGLDYSAFSIMDTTTMPYKQVCTYRNNLVTPIDYADIVHKSAVAYNDAAVLVEYKDMGMQVAYALHSDFEYENMIFTGNAGSQGKKVTAGFGKNIDMGVNTSRSVKATGCSVLKLLVEQNQLMINNLETIAELSTFSKKGTSYEAEPGKHDDVVMGLVLFAWLTTQPYFRDMSDINTLARLRDKTANDIVEDLTPFGFIDPWVEPAAEPIVVNHGGDWMAMNNDPGDW